MNHPTPLETEVKVRISSPQEMVAKLEAQGFQLEVPTCAEQSVLWDRGRELLEQGCALRLRRYAGKAWITWKGPKVADPLLKIRPELETTLADPVATEQILVALGYAPVLVMEKQRALWRSSNLLACLDETPFGNYLELEGEAELIRVAMAALGLEASSVETRSYPTLFRAAGLA